MQIDLKTVQIEPQRKAFDHLVKRFGDKTASRYQEGSYDIQARENLHYRPTWAPQHELYDPGMSRIVMADSDAFRDPRQYYYGAYVLARARQQEAAEGAFAFVESRGLAATVPQDVLNPALDLLLPLRHVAWGANQNNMLIAGYGVGTTFTQPSLYYAMDSLAIAQYLSRVGILFAGPDALHSAREQWLNADRWQPLRRLVEDMLVVRDPFEVFVAQNVALDGLLYPLVYQALVDGVFTARGAAAVSMTTQFQTDWFDETAKWVDSVLKIAAGESEQNAKLLGEWLSHWRVRAASALLPVIAPILGQDADGALAEAQESLAKRTLKAGLSA